MGVRKKQQAARGEEEEAAKGVTEGGLLPEKPQLTGAANLRLLAYRG